MPHLITDPNTIECLDYNNQHYLPIRLQLVDNNVTHDGAAWDLPNGWEWAMSPKQVCRELARNELVAMDRIQSLYTEWGGYWSLHCHNKQAAIILRSIWDAQNVMEKQQWQAQLDDDERQDVERWGELEAELRRKEEESAKAKEETLERRWRRTRWSTPQFQKEGYPLTHWSFQQFQLFGRWTKVSTFWSDTTQKWGSKTPNPLWCLIMMHSH